MYDDILDTIRITDKKLLHFKPSKSSENLRINKNGFLRPSCILRFELLSISMTGIMTAFV